MSGDRHCERSEAIHLAALEERMDCFAALAMTTLETLPSCEKLNWAVQHLAKFVISYNQFASLNNQVAAGDVKCPN
jgi:hypothetical protein